MKTRRPPRLSRRRRRTPLLFGGALLRAGVLVGPPTALLIWGGSVFVDHLNFYLRDAAPLVSQEATKSLQRTVHIGRLTPGLTFSNLLAFVRYPQSFASLPIAAEDISLATKVSPVYDAKGLPVLEENGTPHLFDEPALTGSRLLATAQRATLYVSLPSLLKGDVTGAVSLIKLESPQLWIARDADGHINLTLITPPKAPGTKPSPPFRTVATLTGGHVFVSDYASLPAKATGKPDRNSLTNVHGIADLSGARDYRFDISAQAPPRTLTATRLSGPLRVWGTWGRADVGARIDAPTAESARYLVQARGKGANIPYWYNYFVPPSAKPGAPEPFRIAAGQTDAELSLIGPRPDLKKSLIPGIAVTIGAQFRGGSVRTGYVPLTVSNASGSLLYNDGSVSFDARGSLQNAQGQSLGTPLHVAGALWNLTAGTLPSDLIAVKKRGKPNAELALSVQAPGLAVASLTRTFTGRRGFALPAGLRIGGTARVDALVTGKLSDLSATGTVSGVAAAFTGFPAVRSASAKWTYASGLVSVTDAQAALDGGGTAEGRATIRLTGGTPAEKNTVQFRAAAHRVALSSLRVLDRLNGNANTTLHLSGQGEVEAVGVGKAGALSVAANVSAQGLAVGRLTFPVARARVLVTQAAGGRLAFSLPAAHVESAAGALAANGDIGQNGALHIRWSANSLDIGSLGRAFGFDSVNGLVTASGTIAGTARDPRGIISDLVGVNLRLAVPSAPLTSGAGVSAAAPSPPVVRRFAADVVRGRNIAVTSRGIALNEALVVRRFPAQAFVIGTITDLLPQKTTAGVSRFAPRLNLTAKVENLEFAEVERQLREEVGVAAVRAILKTAAVLPSETTPSLPVSGEITSATFTARGPASSPQIAGTANLGRLLIRAGTDTNTGKPIEYPLDSGAFDFAYDKQRTRITNAVLQASVGTLFGSATLLSSGAISGSFRAPALDTERLAFLTRRYFSLSGKVAATASVSGTLRRPTVTAQITPSNVTVAGLTLSGLTLRDVTYQANLDAGTSRFDLAALTFKQGDATVSVGKTFFELPTNRFATDVQVGAGNIGALIDSLRSSGLRDTEAGANVANALDALPTPIRGEVAINRLRVSGRIAPATGSDGQGKTTARLVDGTGEAELTATDLQVGEFTAPKVTGRATLDGDKITLSNFTAVSPGATFRASGSYLTSGEINLVLESNAARLETLRTFPALASLPLSGAVDLTVVARGEIRKPTITASLQGKDIQVVQFVPDKPEPVPIAGLILSNLRAEGEYTQGEDGLGRITVRDGLVQVGNTQVTAEGTLPISRRPNDPRLAEQMISLKVATNTVNLADFVPLLGEPEKDKRGRAGTPAELSGTLTAHIALGGPTGDAVPVGQAKLSGLLTLDKGRFRLPRPAGDDKDRINPVSDLTARLTLAGDQVNFDQFVLALGGPSNQKGDFGKLTLTGGATLSSLNALQRILTPAVRTDATRPDAAPPPADLAAGQLRLVANFDRFRPVEDNLFGFGEAVKGEVNGSVLIEQSLASPLVHSLGNQPLRVKDPQLTLTSQTATPSSGQGSLAVTPRFDLPVDIEGKASLISPGTFRFDATGGGKVGGSLASIAGPNGPTSALNLTGDLDVLGGYFSLPTARFKVQKGGKIHLAYGGTNAGVRAESVEATTRIYTAGSTNIANYAGGTSGQPLERVQTLAAAPVAQQSRSFDITVTLNGPLLISAIGNGGATDPTRDSTANTLSFTGTDRETGQTLDQKQIIALVGSQEQVDLARQGRVSEAFQGITQQVLYSSFVPRYLAPITDSLQNSLGLTNLSVDYNPQGFTNIFAQARLPDPFERFVAEYQQRIQVRTSQLTQQQPYSFSLGYELFRFKPTSRIQPRMQLGFSSNEQHIFTYFLRGTVAY